MVQCNGSDEVNRGGVFHSKSKSTHQDYPSARPHPHPSEVRWVTVSVGHVARKIGYDARWIVICDFVRILHFNYISYINSTFYFLLAR